MAQAIEQPAKDAQTRNSALAAIRLLRPEQWLKNLLVLLPLLMSHRFAEAVLLWRGVFAAAAFSLVASAGYIWNDWMDRRADALHARKQTRPLASGTVKGRQALALGLACLGCGFVIAWLVEPELAGVLAGYLAVSLLYSTVLKRVALLDALLLAGFYGVRVYAGHVATGIRLSQSLIGFCFAAFFSLAMLKRYSELMLSDRGAVEGNRRSYRHEHREWMMVLGLASALMSVAVVAFYVEGEMAKGLYRHPHVLWLICPLLVCWFARAWVLAKRGMMIDDPLAFAMHDRTTWAMVAAMAVVWLSAL
ncbi:MAG: UbiA family prenyltransferase [Bryobacterales bacterium]|nr:UbiA family prenyltransferase [Bryobacterales bacterium]